MELQAPLDRLIDLPRYEVIITQAHAWFFDNVLIAGNLAQFAVIAATFLLAWRLAPRLAAWIRHQGERAEFRLVKKPVAALLAAFIFPILALIVLWMVIAVANRAGWDYPLLTVVVSLLTAWVVIRLSTRLVRDPVWAKFIALTAWTIAALNIVGLLDASIALLDSLAITIGALRVSALTVIKGVLALAVLVWAATGLAHLLEARIRTSKHLTPSVQELFSKLLKIVLIAVAVVAAVSSVGIDLTAFAVFGGALGVGIGLGLQKAVSNLTSGLMLLMDKSIKPGDVIAVNDSYGWVNSLGARYVSVVTRDGIEHLIPNDDLVTQRVENWTHSNNWLRLKTPVGIHYEADVHQAIRLCMQAVSEHTRVLKTPEPRCLLRGFGDSSVDLEIRMWIQDPQNGVNNIRSEVLLQVWELFHEHHIEIPYPQRDLHLRSPQTSNFMQRDPAAQTAVSRAEENP